MDKDGIPVQIRFDPKLYAAVAQVASANRLSLSDAVTTMLMEASGAIADQVGILDDRDWRLISVALPAGVVSDLADYADGIGAYISVGAMIGHMCEVWMGRWEAGFDEVGDMMRAGLGNGGPVW